MNVKDKLFFRTKPDTSYGLNYSCQQAIF